MELRQASIESLMLFSLLFCAAASLSPAWAQSREEPCLLPEPVHLSGIVTDIDGAPPPDMWIDHTGISAQAVKTNEEGRFDIQTRAPAVVFRSKGFNGRYYRVVRDAAVEIRLVPTMRSLKACSRFARCVRLNGFESVFCFPRVRGISVSRRSYDIDYVERYFVNLTTRGKTGIGHAAGPMWGDGLPRDEDVWSSVEYWETDYPDPEGFFIVDARGETSGGRYWRVLGHSFESATYRGMSADEIGLWDKVLDGVCLLPYPQRE